MYRSHKKKNANVTTNDTKEDKRFFTQRLGKQNFNHLLFSKFRTYTKTIQIIISQP